MGWRGPERERERDERREKKHVFAGSTSMDSSIRPFGRRARFRQLKLFIKRLPVESKHVEREREKGGRKSKRSWKNGR